MASITNDETSFIEDLGRAITSLRIDDWNEGTIKLFIDNLVSLKDKLKTLIETGLAIMRMILSYIK